MLTSELPPLTTARSDLPSHRSPRGDCLPGRFRRRSEAAVFGTCRHIANRMLTFLFRSLPRRDRVAVRVEIISRHGVRSVSNLIRVRDGFEVPLRVDEDGRDTLGAAPGADDGDIEFCGRH